jgi:hypothetical protein
MEVSEGTNRLAEALSEALGGAGEISMLPLAEEIDDKLGEPTEEDAMVQEVLSNVAAEEGDDYDAYSEPLDDGEDDSVMYIVSDGSASDIPGDILGSSDMASSPEDFDFSQLDEEEQGALEQIGMALMSGQISEEDLFDLLT